MKVFIIIIIAIIIIKLIKHDIIPVRKWFHIIKLKLYGFITRIKIFSLKIYSKFF